MKIRDMIEFVNELPDEALERDLSTLTALVHFSDRYRHYCALATGQMTNSEKAAYTYAEGQVIRFAAKLGCKGVEFDEDPRGGMVYVLLPSGRSNSVGHEGWMVPHE